MADKPVRADKATAVAELTEQFRNSAATVLTEYRGLTVSQLTELRRSLGAGDHYTVAKNTLAKRAATDAGIDGLDELFTGPTALAFVSGDPVEAAKGLRDFAKANPLLVIKGGVFEGRAITAAEVSKLADLESREVLLAKLAGAMKANLSKAAALFQAPLSKAARLAAALQDKREKEGADGGLTARTAHHFLLQKQERTPDMAKLSTDELLDAFKEMTLIELSEFVKQFEDDLRGHRRRAGRRGRGRRRRRRRCRRGRAGAGRVRRHPRGRRRQEDPGHQGRARADRPGPEGGQGPGRGRAEGRSWRRSTRRPPRRPRPSSRREGAKVTLK